MHGMNRKESPGTPGMMDTLRSLQFGIVVLIAISVVAVIGTIIPQGLSWEFYSERYPGAIAFLVQVFRFDNTYGSPLFLGLMGLFGLNLVLCTLHRFPGVWRAAFRPDREPEREQMTRMPIHHSVPDASLDEIEAAFSRSGLRLHRVGSNRLYGETGRLGHLGATVVHVSLLLLLAGGMVSLITGKRGHVVLHPGESTALAELPSGSKIPLGFTIQLDRFSVEYYEQHPDRPKSFTSSVTVTPLDGTPFTREIRVNHPLMLNGFTLYQSSFGVSNEQATASTLNDTARVEIRLKGAPPEMPPITISDMVENGVYPVPGFGDSIQVRLAELHRNFRMGESTGEANPAVKLDVLVRGETRWSVYAFQKFPGLNMPMHEDLVLVFTLTGFQSGEPRGENHAEIQYYTVLGAVRDRGIPLMWSGALLMTLGLFLSFYIRPRRLWALAEDGSVHIGARAKGETDSFRQFIERTIDSRHSSR